MEGQVEATERLVMVLTLRAASEAVGRVEMAEEEGEAGVVAVADRVPGVAAPAEVADPFSPRSRRMG